MDKTVIHHAKNGHASQPPGSLPIESGVVTYPVTGHRQEIHEAYGLWLFACQRQAVSPPMQTIQPRRFEFYGLSHLLKGRGLYWTPDSGTPLRYGPGQAVLSLPGMIQDYGGDGTEYQEDSLCFTGPVADALRAAGILRHGVLELGLTRRLEPILDLMAAPAREAQIRANLLLQNLLVDVYFANKPPAGGRHAALARILSQIAAEQQRWWPVREMADQCGLSESQFRRVFITETGLHPKVYVDQYKMKHAAAQLVSRQLTVLAAAAEVGYADPYHFSRRFKQVMGLPPEQYRAQMSLTGRRSASPG